MLPTSLRTLTLTEVTEGVLSGLIEHGESLYVERKRQPPTPPAFGAAVASFANMLGGFLLLGVDDDKSIPGWKPPGRADVQAHLADLLRREVDPLPPFVAGMREIDGTPVGVVRVFESVDTPHVVRGTGAIYLRSQGSKEPVAADDHLLVRELARRGRQAEIEALRRLDETPGVARLLSTPSSGPPRDYEGAEVIARAAPLTVSPALRDWPLTRFAAELAQELAGRLAPPRLLEGFSYGRQGPELLSFGRAVTAQVRQELPAEAATESFVMLDSAGVAAAALRRHPPRNSPPSLLINAMLDDELLPLARALIEILEAVEAIGRAAVDVWVLLTNDIPTTGSGQIIDGTVHVSREITIPADPGEVRALAESWHREIQREFGIVKFEPGPGTTRTEPAV